MMNNNWSELVLDGDSKNIEEIKNSNYYWKYNLNAVSEFITVENINDLLKNNTDGKDVDLLHIDIDGNDYWIWKAVTAIRPKIVIVEYNSVFGVDRPITVPYKPDFIRQNEHFSRLYAGSSLLALITLANEKGYKFIGSNDAGNNAYFIQNGFTRFINEISLTEGYRNSKFREARNLENKLYYPNNDKRLSLISGLPVFNVVTQEIEFI
jgi:hypothetical protein